MMFLSILLSFFIQPASGQDTERSLKEAHADFLMGRLEEAVSGYEYAVTRNPDNLEATVNLALVLQASGKPEKALPWMLKATMLAPQKASLHNQLGWVRLSLDKIRPAQEAFQKALDMSSADAGDRAESGLGLALSALMDKDYPEAKKHFIRSLESDPGSALARYGIGLCAWRKGNETQAVHFLKEALYMDPELGEAYPLLAQAYEKMGENDSAWKVLWAFHRFEPGLSPSRKKMETLASYLSKKPEELLGTRRIAWPLAPDFPPPWESPIVRIGLYAADTGELATLQEVQFIAGTGFKVKDEVLGEVGRGAKNDRWVLTYQNINSTLALKNQKGEIEFVTKRPVRLTLESPQATLLLKNARLSDPTVLLDTGDRELHGHLIAVPVADGFYLVNEIHLEAYLAAILGDLIPENAPPEAAKAAAVTLRTQILTEKGKKHQPGIDFCDGRHCWVYSGAHGQTQVSLEAAQKTYQEVLFSEGNLAGVSNYSNCGGVLESTAPAQSPWELERFIRHPPPDLPCLSSEWVPETESRWIRILDASEVSSRLDAVFHTGNLQALVPRSRGMLGQVTELAVEGSKKTETIREPEQILRLPASAPLRSPLFHLVTLYESNKKPKSFILWGAGTGKASGLCRAGAMGQAALGKKYQEILSYYFPGMKIQKQTEPK